MAKALPTFIARVFILAPFESASLTDVAISLPASVFAWAAAFASSVASFGSLAFASVVAGVPFSPFVESSYDLSAFSWVLPSIFLAFDTPIRFSILSPKLLIHGAFRRLYAALKARAK